MTQAGSRGAEGVPDLARLNSLSAKESSLWLRVLPTSRHLTLTDTAWQWAARLRLGMSVPVYEPSGGGALCSHTAANLTDGWHALSCVTRSPFAITQRHNAVLNSIAHAARAINVPAHIEPAQLAPNDDRRPRGVHQ